MNKTQVIAEAGQSDIQILRSFDAPREKVFRAFCESTLYLKWFMPKAADMQIEHMDCRTGGTYAHSHQMPDGSRYGFRGVYHEVDGPDHIIKTSEFVGLPFKVIPTLEVIRFETNEDGSTRLNMRIICESVDVRDQMVAHGMEPHLQQSHQLLDELLQHQTTQTDQK